MKNLIDIVIREGFADEYLTTEFKAEKETVEGLRKEFTSSLNERIKMKNTVYEDMLKKEKLALQEIESIINHDVIRRASANTSINERIHIILESLVEGKISVLRDYNLLIEIKNALLYLLDEQITFERGERQKIKASIGEDMYNEYEVYFNSNSFLKLIYKNELNK